MRKYWQDHEAGIIELAIILLVFILIVCVPGLILIVTQLHSILMPTSH
jgi:hypothetical protein